MKSFTKEVIYESDPRCSAYDRRIYCYSRSSWRRFVTGLHGHEKPISFNTPLHSELYDAVMRLPSKYRIVTYLYYYEDYSISEISGLTGSTKTAIQTQLMRARAKLKEQLKGEWCISLCFVRICLCGLSILGGRFRRRKRFWRYHPAVWDQLSQHRPADGRRSPD